MWEPERVDLYAVEAVVAGWGLPSVADLTRVVHGCWRWLGVFWCFRNVGEGSELLLRPLGTVDDGEEPRLDGERRNSHLRGEIRKRGRRRCSRGEGGEGEGEEERPRSPPSLGDLRGEERLEPSWPRQQ